MTRTRMLRIVTVAALLGALLAVVMLERQRAGVTSERMTLGDTPVTLWRGPGDDPAPLVVVAHGYAGSRQMMEPISIALARAGFTVAAFDFHGHGRHPVPMDADVTTLEGTTAQLVAQTVAATQAARDLPGVAGPVALLGHSMATDVVIRASDRIEAAAVVAISMYSDAVTPAFPERLLIVSGAFEGRLRGVALDRLHQIDPAAGEGETVTAEGVQRRVVAAPLVGHVGVLYSPKTLAEARDWIADATGRAGSGPLPVIAPWLLLLLASLLALAWPLAMLVKRTDAGDSRNRGAWLALAVPVAPALAAAVFFPAGALGLSAFGALAAFFGVWGVVQLALLWRAGQGPRRVRWLGFALLLVWGLGVFAVLLDRYGAAFIPTGPRLEVMALLLLGTVPFCLGDALMARTGGWVLRLLLRVLPIVTLFGAMLLAPRLGIAFTVLPVMVLFWGVYGLAGRWIAARSGPATAGLALGVILAWAIAASTPLVAA